MELDIKVMAEATLKKEAYAWCDLEDEEERNATTEELFRKDYRSPAEIIEMCERVCRQLVKEGRYFVRYVVAPGLPRRVCDIRSLANDCKGWTEESFDVYEQKKKKVMKRYIERFAQRVLEYVCFGLIIDSIWVLIMLAYVFE